MEKEKAIEIIKEITTILFKNKLKPLEAINILQSIERAYLMEI